MERSDVWFIAVTFGVLGLIVGAALNDFFHEANPLKEYQTLIAGLAAVAAAMATINTMHRTDERQAARHAELMEYTRQPEHLARQRVVEIYCEYFKYLALEAEEIGLLMPPHIDPKEITRPLVEMVGRFMVFLHQAVRDEAIRMARPFFDAKVEMNFSFIALKDEEFEKDEYREFLKTNIAGVMMNRALPDHEDAAYFFKLCHSIQGLSTPLRALSQSLADFDKHHRPSSSS
ncbi:hypothetical protein RFM23_14360 [Mesorhizobium abyssinicae]|uniref:Uncharacterized protein n=1 Tax=Mesorhizobium abyssinicae TaxID=1209958 RepID=A0ABU5ANJ8_9HYPH|nr:hypothetical protein [Mesorhizobium abyssinicae]MDX8538802.1 hypothetical protein [Mesorhizobium abyssinicae]